ncbi:hypothetical protein AB0J52_17270 [Spirillospora sp. NPDC049652]
MYSLFEDEPDEPCEAMELVFGSTRVDDEAPDTAPFDAAAAGVAVRRDAVRRLDVDLVVRGRVEAALDRPAVVLRAVVFRAPVVFLAVDFRAVVRPAVVLAAADVVFERPDAALVFLAVVFLAVADLRAGAFLAVPVFLAVVFRAVVDFRAVVFFAAVDFRAVPAFLAVDFLADADLRAVVPPLADRPLATALAATFIAFAASVMALVAVVIALVMAVMARTEAFALVATDFILVAADLACVAAVVAFLAAADEPRADVDDAVRRDDVVRLAAGEARFAVVFRAAVVRLVGPRFAVDARRVPVAFLAAGPRDAVVRFDAADRVAVLRAVPVRAETVDLDAVDFAAALVRFDPVLRTDVPAFPAVPLAPPAVLRLDVVRDVVLVGT